MMNRIYPLSFLLLVVMIAGCTEDPVFPERTFTVSAIDMPLIGGDAYYELWLSYPKDLLEKNALRNDREYFSAGRFRVAADGALVDLNGAPAEFLIPEGRNPQLIFEAVVSIERPGGSDTVPGARILGGEFQGTASRIRASLEVSGEDAFDVHLPSLDSIGLGPARFILDTPTSADSNDNNQGIWFGAFIGDSLRMGIPLIAQPANPNNPRWEYEAWLTHGNEFISLGRFDNPLFPDQTKAGPGAGPLSTNAYPLPGEDFVSGTARILNDGTYGVVVSLQPIGIELSRPLLTILRKDTIPAGASVRAGIGLDLAKSYPIVEVVIDR